MVHRILRMSAVVLSVTALVACSGNSNRAGGDSTAAAVADSQPGVNAASPSPAGPNADSAQRRDTLSGMSMPTDGPNRGTKPGRVPN